MKTKEIILLVLLAIMTILSIQWFQSLDEPNYVDGSLVFCGLFLAVCIICWLSFFWYLFAKFAKKDQSQNLEREILTKENLKGTGCFVIFILLLVGFVWLISCYHESHSSRHLPERGKLESVIDNTCKTTNTKTLLINGKEYWFSDFRTVLQIDEKLAQKIPCFHGDKFNPIPVIIRMGKKIIPPWKYEREVILLFLDGENNSGGDGK